MYNPIFRVLFATNIFGSSWCTVAMGEEFIFDQGFANYLGSQAELDKADTLVLWADQLLFRDDVGAIGFDLIIVANSVDMGSNRLAIAPLEGTIGKTARGRHGHDITVVVRSLGPLRFDLLGGDGGKGDTGPVGRSGDPSKARRRADGASLGTPGAQGGDGGLGGDGGDLVVYFVDGDESMVSLESQGGAGGEGGDGGAGGFSYAYGITKVEPEGLLIYGGPLQKIKLENGPVGETGSPGQPGSSETTRITTAEFRERVLQYVLREPDELVGSYQIFFANIVPGDPIILEEVPEYKDPGDGQVLTPLTEP